MDEDLRKDAHIHGAISYSRAAKGKQSPVGNRGLQFRREVREVANRADFGRRWVRRTIFAVASLAHWTATATKAKTSSMAMKPVATPQAFAAQSSALARFPLFIRRPSAISA